MTLMLDLSPNDEARLSAAARDKGIEPVEMARRLVTDHLPPLPDVSPGLDAENAAAIALLRSWLKEEATDDPEEIRNAEEELAEFERNMNANRLATGERPLFPK